MPHPFQYGLQGIRLKYPPVVGMEGRVSIPIFMFVC